MKKVLVALTALFLAAGCSKQVVDQTSLEAELVFSSEGQYFVPDVFVSDKALTVSQGISLALFDSALLPQPIDLSKGLNGPFCSGILWNDLFTDIPDVQWNLTGWQEYQVYNPIQHIHHNTDPGKRRVLLTLSSVK